MLTKLRKRSSKGFTLIELLVVVVIIGILAAIALPNFIGVQNKARDASVKANMRTVQIAAESYATDNGGTYPAGSPDGSNAFSSYFPGGNSGGGTPGNAPVNPFDNTATWPVDIAIANIATERGLAPAAAAVTGKARGTIGYAPGPTATVGANVISYGIEGADFNGNALGGNGSGTLVLSNQ